MKQAKTDSLIAETMGMIAFAKGIKVAPALDSEFNEFIFREGQNHKRIMAEMSVWTQGWHKANLA